MFSLLFDPFARAEYCVANSETGIFRSRAWIVISVSISKPLDKAGKDFTKRRENTLKPDKMSVNFLFLKSFCGTFS